MSWITRYATAFILALHIFALPWLGSANPDSLGYAGLTHSELYCSMATTFAVVLGLFLLVLNLPCWLKRNPTN
ncbi:hypothetical protein [Ruficoccus sp. ZRK36]|uniref:hypothetical protein n=1 Tax=Ruficoccus sp. ZRK36 TaxID=2866311 RepID=UPI001C72C8BF|nr:hypothetical protein [Ruficoccus sp. ZRK36]QYY35970.1 hypothetical protein K0V07_00510 [Ruficoccus sp. ZRK36]